MVHSSWWLRPSPGQTPPGSAGPFCPGRPDHDCSAGERTRTSNSRWIAERTGGAVPRFEKVAPGDEQILEDQKQRDLDAVPSFLALRADEHAGGEPERPSG